MTKYLINLVCIVGMAGAAHAQATANLEITATGHAYLVFADGGLGQLAGYEIFDGAVVPTLTFPRPAAPEDGTGEFATGWAPLADQGIPTGVTVGTLPPPNDWFVPGDTLTSSFIGELNVQGWLDAVPGTPVYIGQIFDAGPGGTMAPLNAADFNPTNTGVEPTGRLGSLNFNSADNANVFTTAAVTFREPAIAPAYRNIDGSPWKETGVAGVVGTDFDAVYVENPNGTGVVAVIDLKVTASSPTGTPNETLSMMSGTVMVDGTVMPVFMATLVETVVAGNITASELRIGFAGPTLGDPTGAFVSNPTQTGTDARGYFGTLASHIVVSTTAGDFGGDPAGPTPLVPDGFSNAFDIDRIGAAVIAGSNYPLFDLVRTDPNVSDDFVIDTDDVDELVFNLVQTTIGNGTRYGDANLDGLTDLGDYATWATTTLTTTLGGWTDGDFNGDGLVDLVDYATWATTTLTPLAPSGAPVPAPEPATMALLAIGGLAVIRRRRRA